MFYTFQKLIIETWDSWCGLFSPLPYGDPFVATFVLIALMAMTVKLLAGGETA